MQVSIRIAGPAGYGVKSTGKLLQKALNASGLYTFGYMGYPSLIRGGQNFYQLNISTKPIQASYKKIDIFVPLNTDAYLTYKYDLKDTSLILVDSNTTQINDSKPGQEIISLPVLDILREHSIDPITQNTFMVGLILRLLNLPSSGAKKLIRKKFAKKGEEIIKENLESLKLGFSSYHKHIYDFSSKVKKQKDHIILSGNEAIALGFIKGGGTFYSAYPMTPSTNILHFLAKHGPKYNIIVRQASTEIEAIGVAAGASFAGARVMVGTSGGGLDLMGEFISMLGIAEIPVVIVDAQRTGPGTGLPTWTEQSDLNLAKHIGHGEFPRIVLAPGDPLEAYELTQKALNWAEEWQIPVIFLSDKYLSESFFTVDKESLLKTQIPINRGAITKKSTGYLRYKFDPTGVSKRALPGTQGITQVVNSDEHDEYGNSIESDPLRTLLQSKRMMKLENIRKQMPLPNIYGPRGAKKAIVCWGSMKWPAIHLANTWNEKINKTEDKYAVIHFWFMYPLNYSKLKSMFAKYNEIILLENNSTGQLKTDLHLAGVGDKLKQVLLKFDGEPFFIDEEIKL